MFLCNSDIKGCRICYVEVEIFCWLSHYIFSDGYIETHLKVIETECDGKWNRRGQVVWERERERGAEKMGKKRRIEEEKEGWREREEKGEGL